MFSRNKSSRRCSRLLVGCLIVVIFLTFFFYQVTFTACIFWNTSQWSWGIVWGILAVPLMYMVALSYVKAAFTSPGFVDLDWGERFLEAGYPAINPHPQMHVFAPQMISFCKKCNCYRPERAHHCSTCNRCVLRMDHHCPWFGTCVGFRNHKLFVTCLFWITVTSVFFLLVVRKSLFAYLGTSMDIPGLFAEDRSSPKFQLFMEKSREEEMDEIVFSTINFFFPAENIIIPRSFAFFFPICVSLIYSLAGIMMLLSQFYMMSMNNTTLEVDYPGTNPYCFASRMRNLKTFMGERVFDWFFPFVARDIGDGYSFALATDCERERLIHQEYYGESGSANESIGMREMWSSQETAKGPSAIVLGSEKKKRDTEDSALLLFDANINS